MLPDNKLSSQPMINIHKDIFINPERHSLLQDFEWGGKDLQDKSEGLNSHLWQSQYNRHNGEVILGNNEVSHALLNVANVDELAFAFDINMQPVISYMTDGETYLYWYDSNSSKFMTTFIGDTIRCPRLTLDDRRVGQSNSADVIFVYIREAILYVRNQRERYLVEYALGPVDEKKRLWHVSMMNNYRVGFMFKE